MKAGEVFEFMADVGLAPLGGGNIAPQESSSPPPPVAEIYQKALLSPYNDYFSRPHKKFRRSLVEAGFLTFSSHYSASKKMIGELGLFIEEIHLGSLIVDDIQDGSTIRRGRLTLHQSLGAPLSLNFGNWLYFRALRRLSLLSLDADIQPAIFDSVTYHLERAHRGQAIDLAARLDEIDKTGWTSLVEESLRLKSGSLMALALELGAHLTGKIHSFTELRELGIQLGVSLQKLDDLGNVNSGDEKELEDFLLFRPNYVLAMTSELLSNDDFDHFFGLLEAFRAAPAGPAKMALKEYLEAKQICAAARERAEEELETTILRYREDLQLTEQNPGWLHIQEICERLKNAYSKQ